MIQNYELRFYNETLSHENETKWPFFACTDRFLSNIRQLCKLLADPRVSLKFLHVSFFFGCLLDDLNYMACLLEPLTLLRGVGSRVYINVLICQHLRGQDETLGTQQMGTVRGGHVRSDMRTI